MNTLSPITQSYKTFLLNYGGKEGLNLKEQKEDAIAANLTALAFGGLLIVSIGAHLITRRSLLNKTVVTLAGSTVAPIVFLKLKQKLCHQSLENGIQEYTALVVRSAEALNEENYEGFRSEICNSIYWAPERVTSTLLSLNEYPITINGRLALVRFLINEAMCKRVRPFLP